MPTENKPAEPFRREDRYIVIKRTDMEKVPTHLRRNFSGRCRALHEQMLISGAPARSFLVIESDWPEYEPVWQMIERRMVGQPQVTAADELNALLHWRDKHAKAIRERDALQLRLNAAEQRIDELAVPAGYCLMPTRLTAENGAKALLLGEFKLEVTTECPECRELEEPLEGCEVCDGEGEYGQQHMIPWDQIKFIYSEAVKGLAKNPNTPQ